MESSVSISLLIEPDSSLGHPDNLLCQVYKARVRRPSEALYSGIKVSRAKLRKSIIGYTQNNSCVQNANNSQNLQQISKQNLTNTL